MICDFCNSIFSEIDRDIMETALFDNWKYLHCNKQRLFEKKQKQQEEEKEFIELKIELLKLQSNQPERSKREDSFDVRCMESESKGYFVTAQIAGTSDWIEMRCSEHCSNAVREVQ